MSVISRGLEGIIAAETRIGDVRGQEGQLIYCGYDINELAGKVSYEEVVHLLWHNRLPNQRELDKLTTALRAERELPQGVIDWILAAPKEAAPIDIMRTAVSAAIGALKGPLHGGANEGVIHMLQEIGSLDHVDAWVEDALAQKKKIMGIGHRVYKVLDPRAPHLKAMAIKLSEQLGEAKWI